MMRLVGVVTATVSLAFVVFACGNDSGSDDGSSGGGSSSGTSGGGASSSGAASSSGGSSSGGSSGTSTSTSSSGSSGDAANEAAAADCSMHAKVDDKPACDTCTKQKCCAEILKCDASQDCTAAQKCLDACAKDDTECALSCYATHETGAEALVAIGGCAMQNCATECQ